MEKLGTLFFVLAILHGFLAPLIDKWEKRRGSGPLTRRLLYFVSEIEVPFGLWAALLGVTLCFYSTPQISLAWIEETDFTEAIFVFVVLLSASTAPVLNLTDRAIKAIASIIPASREYALFFAAFIVGPLVGSLITEPAAMTVTASFLLGHFFSRPSPKSYRYALLALLLINVSIGGALTHFSAPPILMVANRWGWDTPTVFSLFGIHSLMAVFANTTIVFLFFKKQIKSHTETTLVRHARVKAPIWVALIHVAWLVFVVALAHHPKVLLCALPFFLGFCFITKDFQEGLKYKESLLVAFFLGGLVMLGRLQTWWLQPLLESLQSASLFLGAIGLTAFLDNAALTFLGSQVPNLSDATKYFLVSGALIGGGLTLIANAPNPIAASLLHEPFEKEGGINPLWLLALSLPLTILTAAIFWFIR